MEAAGVARRGGKLRTLSVRYLAPAPIEQPLTLRARVTGIEDERKYTLMCHVNSGREVIAEADVIGFLVWRSDREEAASRFTASAAQARR